MSILVGIAGQSGHGKSTSIRNLNPEETFIISVLGKPLPFAGARKKYTKLKKEDGKYVGNLYVSNNADNIIQIFNVINKTMPHIKNIVIDDASYLMSCESFDKAEIKGYDKFITMAKNYYNVLMTASALRDDLKVFFITHTENAGDTINPQWKVKTLGKVLDNNLNVDGLFTYLIYTELIEGEDGEMKHVFRTRTVKGEDTCKTPDGVFKDLYIPNDLQTVAEAIDKYELGE